MTTITRTFPTFKITKNGESVSVTVDKRTVQITSPAKQGLSGLSAYQIWLNLGNVGTEQDFIDSLSKDNIIYALAF